MRMQEWYFAKTGNTKACSFCVSIPSILNIFIGTRRTRLAATVLSLLMMWIFYIAPRTGMSPKEDLSFGMPLNEDLFFGMSLKEDLIIFYNLFIPAEGTSIAIDVFHDQMKQVSSALAHRNGTAHVFYNLIGDGKTFQPKEILNFCSQINPRLNCQLINHYNEGDESVTLQDVYDFCHSDQVKNNDQLRVTYLHSKGTHHPRFDQHPFRREVTRASLHPDCLSPPDHKCDVCGAQFYTLFAMIFPGNMWTAKCSYIRNLLPPRKSGEYEKRKDESIKLYLMLRAESVFVNNVVEGERVDMYGLGRYMYEHWVTSHPSLNPCELHSTEVDFYSILSSRVVTPEHDEWGMYARRGWIDPSVCTHGIDELDDDDNFRSYHYLAGNMIKWITLYGEVPTQESWVWSHFRGGAKWKGLVRHHGVDVLNAISKNHGAPATHNTKALSLESVGDSDPSIVVFYHISFSAGREEAFEAVKSQFNLLSSLARIRRAQISLYYAIVGGNEVDDVSVANICADGKGHVISCRSLGVYDSTEASGVTLGKLHTFCSANPSFSVIYITNHPESFHTEDVDNVQVVPLAVIDLFGGLNDMSNVCGINSTSQPLGMFSASCGYVKKLLPPETIEKYTRDAIGEAFLAYLKHLPAPSTQEDLSSVHWHSQRFNSVFSQLTLQTLGLQQYPTALWIGGHPDFKPCDHLPSTTRQVLSSFRKITTDRDNGPFVDYFLVGLTALLWRRSYGAVPSLNGWLWQRFPEADFTDNDIIGFLLDSWKHCVDHCTPLMCLDRTSLATQT